MIKFQKTAKNLLVLGTVTLLALSVFGCKNKDNDSEPVSGDSATASAAAATESVENTSSEGPVIGDETSTETAGNPSSTSNPTDSSTGSSADTPYTEPTQAPAIEPAEFDMGSINVGDTFSVFTVTEKNTLENGDITVCFEGSLTVNGIITKNSDGTYLFIYTSEYASLLPLPTGLDEPRYIILDNSAAGSLTTADGAVSITFNNYKLTVSTDSEVTASSSSFVQAKGEYAVIG